MQRGSPDPGEPKVVATARRQEPEQIIYEFLTYGPIPSAYNASMPQREADMPPHILAVFNQLFEELKSTKQQQWTITNYGLLILAAIYAIRLSGVPHSQTYLKILAGTTANTRRCI
jgi:hypothetical protein